MFDYEKVRATQLKVWILNSLGHLLDEVSLFGCSTSEWNRITDSHLSLYIHQYRLLFYLPHHNNNHQSCAPPFEGSI